MYFVDDSLPIQIITREPEEVPGTTTVTPLHLTTSLHANATSISVSKLRNNNTKKQKVSQTQSEAPVDQDAPEVFSYDDVDSQNTLPNFTPSRPPGPQMKQQVLRGQMTNAEDFFLSVFLKGND